MAVLEVGEFVDGNNDESDDTDNSVDRDKDTEGVLELWVSVGRGLVVGEAEGVANPKMEPAVSVSA